MPQKSFQNAKESIFKKSSSESGVHVRGIDFNHPIDLKDLLHSFHSAGFQATQLAQAIEIIKKMRAENVKIFLGFTSNQVSCGNREIIRYLVQHQLVHGLVTTTGGIEEDFIKCHAPFIIGDFKLDGADLRKKGINRIGNLLAPNERYVWFEKFFQPILKELLEEQLKNGKIFSPSEIISKMGKKINSEKSIYYWAHKNNIPVFCPGFMDGAVGDNCYFFNHDLKQKLIIDHIQDQHKLIELMLDANETGLIIVGGGIIKHTLCNANMFREGAKYAVYLNTAPEFDGSDSGAEPEEAKSWGKLTAKANTVKVFCDASIAFPLMVYGAFVEKE